MNFLNKLFFLICNSLLSAIIWTYTNADEKAHTFSSRSNNVQKRIKTDEKRILQKSVRKRQKSGFFDM